MIERISADWILTESAAPLPQGSLSLDKASGLIEAIGLSEEEDFSGEGTTFLTPGLVNAHTHLELYAETPIPIRAGESMADWLTTVNLRNQTLTDEDRLEACRKSIHEMIKTGTTCVNDLTSCGMSLEALDQIGMRGV